MKKAIKLSAGMLDIAGVIYSPAARVEVKVKDGASARPFSKLVAESAWGVRMNRLPLLSKLTPSGFESVGADVL